MIKKYQHGGFKIIFFLAASILIVLSFISYQRIQNLIEETELVNHTHATKLEVNKTLSILLEVESNQRGYILSKDSAFLSPVLAGKAALNSHLTNISTLINANPSQQQNLKELKAIVFKRLDFLHKVLDDSGGSRIDRIRLLQGKALMDDVSKQIRKMEIQEDTILKAHSESLRKSVKIAPLLTVILIIGSIQILFISYFRIMEELKISDTLKSQIENSEDRYQRMISEVKDYAILFLNKDGVIENWNEGAKRIKGYEAQEVIGKNFNLFYTEKDRQLELPQKLLAEATQKDTAQNEGWRVRKDGSLFWGSIVITALHDKKNNLIGFTKFTRDLTTKKIAEDRIKEVNKELENKNAELKRSGERFLKIFDNNPIAMTFAEIGTNKVIYANNIFYNTFGYAKEEVLGHSTEELNIISKAENERLIPIVMDYLQEGRSVEELKALSPEETSKLLVILKEKMFENGFEILYTKKTGEDFFANIYYEVIDMGDKKYTLTSYQDITERKKIEQQLAEQKAFAELIVDNDPAMILAYDLNLNIILWNKKSEEHTGLKREDVIGKNTLELFPEYNNEQWLSAINSVLVDGKSFHYPKVKFLHKKGYGESWGIPLRNTGQQIIGLLFITRDISENVEMTKALEQNNSDLKKINKELESFNYISSHDLQEPLRQIQNFASRIIDMEQNNLSEKGKDYFEKLNNAAKRMQTLITDLLAYSQTKIGVKKYEVVNLKEMVNEVIEDFTEIINEKQAIIEVEDLVDLNVIHFQFRQMIHNLIGNALKFSKTDTRPHIVIINTLVKSSEITNLNLLPDTDYYHISVADNGIGFEQQYKDRIFEVFQRLNDKQKIAGTGIGLAIVKKIVDNHNGIITATSELNKGATFDIFIPTIQNNNS